MSTVRKLLGKKRSTDENIDLLSTHFETKHKKKLFQMESSEKKESPKNVDKSSPMYFSKVRSKDILEGLFSYLEMKQVKYFHSNVGNRRLRGILKGVVYR
jgi:hypothetical protein